ncbi:MAG: hypothetical protein LUD17_02595 [Bacteroidales bacterium]|nr:hypothetical protein [Bacteroidales bacterium]
MKKILAYLMPALLLAGCSSDELKVADQPANQGTQALDEAISFGSESNSVSRAAVTGAEAAALLGNEFRVYGINTKDGATSAVFDNYVVSYVGDGVEDDSNVYGWSYLQDAAGNPLTSLGTSPATQEIKYWDLDADQYDFVAFSGLDDTKQLVGVTSHSFDVDANTLGSLFVSQKVSANYDGSAGVQYGQKINFNFLRMLSRIRIGFYETIPGYAVKNMRFYYDANALSTEVSTISAAGLRGAFPVDGSYTVTYDTNNAPVANLQANSASVANHLVLGELDYTSAENSLIDRTLPYLDEDGNASATPVNSFLSTTSALPTFAKQDAVIDGVAVANSDWQNILPYTKDLADDDAVYANNLVLRCDFELVPLDGGATIKVYNASAVVPASWTQWKPNYAYTYIFKLTSAVQGSTTPPDPSDPQIVDPNRPNPNPNDPPEALTPIVFDAEVSSVENYNQETITNTTQYGGDAITTYSADSNVTDAGEYYVGNTITLSSYSFGRWSYLFSDVEIDEQTVASYASSFYGSWTVLAGADDGTNTVNQNGVSTAQFTADQAGYYVVQLYYLPLGMQDDYANYVSTYKVVKVVNK